jgi:hypothetical protein
MNRDSADDGSCPGLSAGADANMFAACPRLRAMVPVVRNHE